jgi:hypothetical protein
MNFGNPLPPQQPSYTKELLSALQGYNDALQQETFLPPERKVEFDTLMQDYEIPDIKLPNE